MGKEPMISPFKHGCSFSSLALRPPDRLARVWNSPLPTPPNSARLPPPPRSSDVSAPAPTLLCPRPVTHPRIPERCSQVFSARGFWRDAQSSTCLGAQSALPPVALTPELVSSTADTRLAHSFGDAGQDFSPAPPATRRIYIWWGGGRGILYFGLVCLS